MIQHVWSVACQSASFDTQTNSVSLLNTLENIIVFGEPTQETPAPLSCEIVSLWARESADAGGSGQMRVLLNLPGGKPPDVIMLDIDLTRTLFHRTRITIGVLPLTSSGRFEFQVEYRLAGEETWQLAAKLPFVVLVQKLENIAPANH